MQIFIIDHYIQLEDETGNVIIKTNSWKELEQKMKEELEKREKEKRKWDL